MDGAADGPVDLAVALRWLGGDQGLLRELVGIFIDDGPKRLEALRQAIREKQIRVALDVFADEPAAATGAFADPIVKEPGVYGTHHIGASTDQAQEAIAAETVRIVKKFKETGVAPNAVN